MILILELILFKLFDNGPLAVCEKDQQEKVDYGKEHKQTEWSSIAGFLEDLPPD